MRFSVIRDNNIVYVDGLALPIDCSSLPTYVHAIQWYGDKGEIEFSEDADGRRLPNLKIVDISPYQYLIDAHAQAKASAEA